MSSRPARDGETLSDVPIGDEQLAYFRRVARTYGPGPEADMLWLCDAVAALRAQLAEAGADTVFVDYLESLGCVEITRNRAGTRPEWTELIRDDATLAKGPTLRAAIDAARAASGEGETSHPLQRQSS